MTSLWYPFILRKELSNKHTIKHGITRWQHHNRWN